ncbi:5-dehydro-4-deoxyglucarate dehydratase [Rossellomorea aquimaris]|uniref:Probable 5-dehydro-4-deoxyglucarate dehydratase n=1 Tax=Rossellomorea aquimaris TaxID=189382 RepID=A0A5D4TT00_9BACI|nr:5-dehydro-4-deoxyglucarate dehydratase [Rossellomorea aquimaris]TYS77931.1 5-dehydro-4-deoxyglucarate dehydratase [Rossellomorea aquimaris]TYS87113.1 5-dehydro-4-deoxyglucarate dehydratase [Rossellomorea aquimaris]
MIKKRKAPTGILGFPTAPYNENGDIDERALAKNIEFLIKGGLSSIFIACGSGEFHALNKAEYQSMVEVAVSVVNGRVPVYSGVGGSIADSVDLVRLSENLGVDGYLILPPYLIEGEQEGLYNYYKTIIQKSSLPAILYQRDNAVLQLATLKRLIEELPQIVGVKDGYGNMELNLELTQTLGDKVEWLNGMPFAEITMPAYHSIGFNSYSSAMSNYIPHVSRLYYDSLKEGNEELVKEIYVNVLLPINQIRKARKGYAVSLIKAGMEIIGMPVANTVRPPCVPVEKEHYEQLKAIIENTLEKYPIKHVESKELI